MVLRKFVLTKADVALSFPIWKQSPNKQMWLTWKTSEKIPRLLVEDAEIFLKITYRLSFNSGRWAHGLLTGYWYNILTDAQCMIFALHTDLLGSEDMYNMSDKPMKGLPLHGMHSQSSLSYITVALSTVCRPDLFHLRLIPQRERRIPNLNITAAQISTQSDATSHISHLHTEGFACQDKWKR